MSNDNSGPVRKQRHARTITKRTSKRRGELAELAFLWKAASLGFTVAKPYGDSDRYDFILDSGGRLIRVQVKSTSCLSQGTYFLTAQRCSNGVAIPYTSDEIDFLVGYIFPEDAWVIIPVEALAGHKSIHLFPRDRADTDSTPSTAKPGANSPAHASRATPPSPPPTTSTSSPAATSDATTNARCALDRDWVTRAIPRDLRSPKNETSQASSPTAF